MVQMGRPVIFGEVLFDCFPDGSEVLGGAPFNVAWHLRGFGEQPLFISRVGDDAAGRQVREAMSRWGMDTAGLQTDMVHPTGRVRIEFVSGEPQFSILPDQAYDHVDPTKLVVPERPVFLYHGSLALRGPQSRGALAALLERRPVPVFLDVNLRPPWWSPETLTLALAHATWLKLNAGELDQLSKTDGNVVSRARDIRDRFGLEQVVVTLGAEGALAVTAQLESEAVKPEAVVDVVDTVGAGDAFASVLTLGILRGWTLQTTLQRAQSFASGIVGVRGATVAEPAFYQHYLEAWRQA